MNLRTLLLLALLAGTLNTMGQPPQERNERRERPGRPQNQHPEGQRPGHDRPAHDRHQPVIERWLNHLEKQNPEEHRRLTDLREENPRAFREEMRRQFARAREQQHARRGARGTPPEFSEHLQAFQNARNDTEREQARENLRAVLTEHIDHRLSLREQRIQSIRGELERLETQHQTDKSRRDEWIEETLTRMLEK